MRKITWNTIPYALQLIIKLLVEQNVLLKQKLLLPEKVPRKPTFTSVPAKPTVFEKEWHSCVAKVGAYCKHIEVLAAIKPLN